MTRNALRLSLLTAALAAVLAAAPASAQNINVSATVAKACTFSVTQHLSFGAYDPVAANLTAPLDGEAKLDVRCTRGTSYHVALGAGANAPGVGTTRAMVSGTERLNYDLYLDATHTSVWGDGAANDKDDVSTSRNAVTYTVYGRVPEDQDPPIGASFADSVVVTVNVD